MLRPGEPLARLGHLLRADTRGKHSVAPLGEAVKDFYEVFRALAGAEDHLGHAHAQRAVMVHLRKAQIFKRQGPDLFEGGLRGQFPGAHLLQQDFQAVRIHVSSLSS